MRSYAATSQTYSIAKELVSRSGGDFANNHGVAALDLFDSLELNSLDAKASKMVAAEIVRSVALMQIEQSLTVMRSAERIGIASTTLLDDFAHLVLDRIDSVVDAFANEYNAAQYLASQP